MKLLICSVFDKKVAGYTPPQYFRTKGEAMRAFIDACADRGSHFVKHPEDYVFMVLGSFDDQSGEISGDGMEPIMTALDAVGVSEREGVTTTSVLTGKSMKV